MYDSMKKRRATCRALLLAALLAAGTAATAAIPAGKPESESPAAATTETATPARSAEEAGAPAAEEPEERFSVHINGTVRAKFEYQPAIGAARFEVRNARFCLSGNVTRVMTYKAEVDLSDEGRIRMLDAYVRLAMLRQRNLRLTVGQMRVPFTVDAHRSPHEQYFANRSFIAKQAGNVRDVGAALGWSFGGRVPVTLEGGIFNGSGLTDQKDFWTDDFNCSFKAQALFARRVCLTLSYQKTTPGAVAIRMYDAGINYADERWHAEAEYLRKQYAHEAFPGVDAVDAFVCRTIPTPRSRTLRQVALLARYDYLSDHSNGVAGADGVLVCDDPARHRLTGGLTFSLGLPFRADIRLNYEAYFYRKGITPAHSEQDKLVVELMCRF